jgi:hypothetical protein
MVDSYLALSCQPSAFSLIFAAKLVVAFSFILKTVDGPNHSATSTHSLKADS